MSSAKSEDLLFLSDVFEMGIMLCSGSGQYCLLPAHASIRRILPAIGVSLYVSALSGVDGN